MPSCTCEKKRNTAPEKRIWLLSDIWSEYDENFGVFYSTVLGDIEKIRKDCGNDKGAPGAAEKFLPRLKPAVAKLYEFFAGHIYRKRLSVSADKIRQIF